MCFVRFFIGKIRGGTTREDGELGLGEVGSNVKKTTVHLEAAIRESNGVPSRSRSIAWRDAGTEEEGSGCRM
jgi:hypothetical protein